MPLLYKNNGGVLLCCTVRALNTVSWRHSTFAHAVQLHVHLHTVTPVQHVVMQHAVHVKACRGLVGASAIGASSAD